MLLYGVVVMALFQSKLPWILSLIFTYVLGVYFLRLWRLKTPGSPCEKLLYTAERWHVYSEQNSFEPYQTVQLRFDFGWLMWLVFENTSETEKSTRKHILLFQDQMVADDSRLIRLILRTH